MRGLEPIGPVYEGHSAAQTFVQRELPLVGIDLQMATYARQNAGTVTLRVRERVDGPDLRVATVRAADLRDSAVHPFRFPSVGPGESSGRQLAFVVESTAEDVDNAVTAWQTYEDAELGGTAFYLRQPVGGDLVFAPVYGESVVGAAAGQVRRLVEGGLAPWVPILLLLGPGLLLSVACLDRRTYGLGTQLAAAPAFGVAAGALGLLWATTLGLRLDATRVGIGLACSLFLVVILQLAGQAPCMWPLCRFRRSGRAGARPPPRGPAPTSPGGRGQAAPLPDEKAMLVIADPIVGLGSRRVGSVQPSGDYPPPQPSPARGEGGTAGRAPTLMPHASRLTPEGGSPLSFGRRLDWSFLVALAAVGIGLLGRLIALDGGAVPPGADAYHHVLVTQLLLDQGGLPMSYAPYAPIDTFSYHFGFHAYAALVAWATGRPTLEAVQMVSALLNAVAALSVYALVRMAGLGGWAGAAVAAVVALASPFPMGLLGVARYPQAAALVILPVAAGLVLSCPRRGSSLQVAVSRFALRGTSVAGARLAIGIAVLASGLFLTHYRVALMFAGLVALLVMAWALGTAARRVRQVGFHTPRAERPHPNPLPEGGTRRPHPNPLPEGEGTQGPHPDPLPEGEGTRSPHPVPWLVVAAVVGGGLLAAPWGARLTQSFTLGLPAGGVPRAPDYYSLDRLGEGPDLALGALLIAMALAGWAIAAVTGRSWLVLLGIWAGALLALSNPGWLPLPGAGAVDLVTVVSSLFVPAAPAIALALVAARCGLAERAPALATPVVVLVVAGLAVWGSGQLGALAGPDERLADAADLEAARWVHATLPVGARLAVNATIRRWEPDFVVPTDGGQWLPLLAGRATTLLPLLYPAERGTPLREVERMEEIARDLGTDPSSPETLSLLRAAGVTHLYLGARGGPIEEGRVAASPAYRKVYGSAGVSIYQLQTYGVRELAPAVRSASGGPSRASGAAASHCTPQSPSGETVSD